ncbi:predicted protein [Naegleria gruberi]|uniref:E2 ubiquitin-conjugating enzyme n=1 Tax=Naegleria gruberi TaxID=5762 RepID=D2VUU0_NAEGR|nr:uncharacterized protein NAEGRDRAFT_81299 [Naegleria gruberi]EFC39319.1 predicted protein [Naegleria gruberi]|eukprot:XP_002672063.1 predicted protein [Naegleria gruberi strain NEG-M]
MSTNFSQGFLVRMKGELKLLKNQPPHGIAAYPKNEDRIDILEAKIQGTQGTPYEGGEFVLEITLPNNYPHHPPNVRFITKIYHPNFDSGGRICLDLLNMPPKGAWKPSINISTLLASIKLLMDEPNGDDGLMADITEQFRNNRQLFEKIAKEWTKKYAITSFVTTDSSEQTKEEENNAKPPVESNDKSSEKEKKVRKINDSSSSDDDDSSSSSEDEEEGLFHKKMKKRKL